MREEMRREGVVCILKREGRGRDRRIDRWLQRLHLGLSTGMYVLVYRYTGRRRGG